MAEMVRFCRVVLFVGLAGLLVSHTHTLHLAKGLPHSLRGLSVELVMALSHILHLKVRLCSLQVQMVVLAKVVFRILQVQMAVLAKAVFHILQVQMAVLVKVVFHSLERTDFFHIQQAHLGRRIAQDDLLEDSR